MGSHLVNSKIFTRKYLPDCRIPTFGGTECQSEAGYQIGVDCQKSKNNFDHQCS